MAGRRSNNDGGRPRQRADGRWQAEIIVGYDEQGRQIRKSVYGKTSTECAGAVRKLLREVQDGTVTLGDSPTLQDWLDHWLYVVKAETLAPLTFDNYEAKIKTWIRGTKIARTKLHRVTAEQIEGVYRTMIEAGMKPATAQQVHAILSGAFKEALKKRRIGSSPMDKVNKPLTRQQDTFRPKILTATDAQKLIDAADKLPTAQAARWLLALSYGPRQSEALGLGWDMLDLERGTVRIERKLYARHWRHGCADSTKCPAKNGKPHLCPERTGGGMFFGTPKSFASHRTNVLPDQLLEKFRTLRAEQDELDAIEGERRQPFTDPNGVTVDLVFSQLNGRPHRPETDNLAWKAFLTGAGVDEVRLHDARHTAATMLLRLGVDPRIVMDIMGWSQMSMLHRYQHVLEDMKRDVAKQISGALWVEDSPPDPEPEGDTVVSLDSWRSRRAV